MFTLVRKFRPHVLPVTFGAFDESGARFITGSYDKTAVVWSVTDGETLFVLQGHTNAVYCGAFNLPGDRVCTGSFDKTARIWDACNGLCMHILRGHQTEIICLDWSHVGDLVATGCMDNTCRVWCAQQGTTDCCLTGHTKEVVSVSFNKPFCDKILTGSFDKTAIIWEVCSGRRLFSLSGHSAEVVCVQFECFGNFCITASLDKTCCLWNLSSGDCVHKTCEHDGEVLDVCFNFEGTHFASGSGDGIINVYGIDPQSATVTRICKLVGHDGEVTKVRFLPEESYIISCSSDRTCRLWDWKSARCVQVLEGHCDEVYDVCISAGGTKLATVSKDNSSQNWERVPSLILTLTRGPCETDGTVPIICTGLSGNDLATIQVESGGAQSLPWFRNALAEHLQVHPYSLQLMTVRGELLSGAAMTLLEAIAD